MGLANNGIFGASARRMSLAAKALWRFLVHGHAVDRIAAYFVHGEYTVHNVMMRGADVYPIDWESAAVGFGEVDLVCLLDNCTDDVIEKCTQVYARARWPGGEPIDLSSRLLSAELYLHLRWLGEKPADMATVDGQRRLGRLRAIAHELDIAGARS